MLMFHHPTIKSRTIILLGFKKEQYKYDILKCMRKARKKHSKDWKLLISGEWCWVNGGLIFLLQAFRTIYLLINVLLKDQCLYFHF